MKDAWPWPPTSEWTKRESPIWIFLLFLWILLPRVQRPKLNVDQEGCMKMVRHIFSLLNCTASLFLQRIFSSYSINISSILSFSLLYQSGHSNRQTAASKMFQAQFCLKQANLLIWSSWNAWSSPHYGSHEHHSHSKWFVSFIFLLF